MVEIYTRPGEYGVDYVTYFLAVRFYVSPVPWWDSLVDCLSVTGELSESVWMIPTWEAFERASV